MRAVLRERFPDHGILGEEFGLEQADSPYRWVLEQLMDAGLGSMPGGGAEIFDESVRSQICEHKADGQAWLDIHREAHGLGLRTNATMLYGHIETDEERVDHFIQLRELQDALMPSWNLGVRQIMINQAGRRLDAKGEKGFGRDQLAEMQRIIDAESSDLFDVLAHIAYAMAPLTREQRALRAMAVISENFNSRQQVFLDFLGAPADDVRRTREGIYWSHVHGPVGKRIQVILLDARYFRSPLKKGFDSREPGEGYRGRYVPNTDESATVLGEAQWKWLEEQLKVPAELRVIGSSYQVLSNQHGWEMWGNFPNERARLFRVLKESKAEGVVMISGDRHLAEIAKLDGASSEGIGYPLVEVTSSSLNQPSGNLTKGGVRFANEINPYREGLTYFDINYGNILVDWAASDPVVRLQVCDEHGTVMLQHRMTLSQLKP